MLELIKVMYLGLHLQQVISCSRYVMPISHKVLNILGLDQNILLYLNSRRLVLYSELFTISCWSKGLYYHGFTYFRVRFQKSGIFCWSKWFHLLSICLIFTKPRNLLSIMLFVQVNFKREDYLLVIISYLLFKAIQLMFHYFHKITVSGMLVHAKIIYICFALRQVIFHVSFFISRVGTSY